MYVMYNMYNIIYYIFMLLCICILLKVNKAFDESTNKHNIHVATHIEVRRYLEINYIISL